MPYFFHIVLNFTCQNFCLLKAVTCSMLPSSTHVSALWVKLCWNFKQSMAARNRVGIEFPYRPARLYWLAELIPWKQFLGSLKV
jgi:hypothetical protein